MSESKETLSADLRWRGLIYQTSDDAVATLIDAGEAVAYIGFDPTSDSLHVGNLIQLLNLRRLQLGGNRPITVAGGATGMVGDPSGKSAERNLLDREVLAYNVERIKVQLAQIIDFDAGSSSAKLVNNADWLGEVALLDFLRDIGKHVTVNQMIAKDSVRTRLSEREHGISYTEFSYMLLQATDYLHLYDNYACNLQMGASDQWGNITIGIDLIRRARGAHVHGMTSPLLLKPDGTKFGKSEAGAIYLDPEKTSPYDFYQFFLRSEDAVVIQYLKFFTFLKAEEIDALEVALSEKPELRLAQHALASELTALIHGSQGLELARQASEALFSTEILSMDARAINMALAGAPVYIVEGATLSAGIGVVDVLAASALVKSRSEARKLISQGGIYLNNSRVHEASALLSSGDLLPGGKILLRKGKKDYLAITVT